MLVRVKQLLAAPVFEGDEEKTRIASLLNTLALVSGLLFFVAGVVHVPARLGEPDVLPNLVRIAITTLIILLVLFLIRRGGVRAASLLFSAVVWISIIFIAYTTGGVRSFEYSMITVVVLMVGLLLGTRAAIVAAVFSLLAGLGMAYAETQGLLLDVATYAPLEILSSRGFELAAVIVLLYLTARGIGEAFQRARHYATELEAQRRQLEETVREVRERTHELARRANYLEATTEVARDAAAVLDLQELLSRVVRLISEQFGFYHTGIFLLDPTGEWAVFQAASSEGGQRMLARGHRLGVGQEGIVGYVTGRGEHRIALDVGKDAVFLDNPDLPHTRSEVALPLQVRGKIIGALDVQSTEPEAFSDEDVAVLQTLADQVAVTISNARLFQQLRESLEAERRAYGELSRDAWRELLQTQLDLGVLSNRQGIFPARDFWRTEMEVALHTGETTLNDQDTTTLAVPLKIRDQVIGIVDGRKPDDAGEWTAEEVVLIETLTEQLSMALESARLYQDTQQRAAREQLTGEVTARMRETLDVETVLKTAAQEMRQALGLSKMVIRLATEEPDDGATA